MTVEEGAFTITSTVGGGNTCGAAEVNVTESETEKTSSSSSGGPTPRFGASMAVAKSGQLFLFGGMVEDGDKQITLNDFYCLGEEPSYLELVWDFCGLKIKLKSKSHAKLV